MRITYHPEANAAYIHLTSQHLTPGRLAIQAPMPPGSAGFIALDWKDGRLAGIEILDPTRHLHDDLLQAADTECPSCLLTERSRFGRSWAQRRK